MAGITTSGDPTSIVHQRQNHDGRRYGSTSASTYAETTGTDTSSQSVTIPASLIAQQQAAESQNAENVGAVQDVIPPRPLGL